MSGLRGRALVAWLTVCIVWGTTYLAIRVGVRVMPPFLFGAARFIVAGVLLGVPAWLLGARFPKRPAECVHEVAGTGRSSGGEKPDLEVPGCRDGGLRARPRGAMSGRSDAASDDQPQRVHALPRSGRGGWTSTLRRAKKGSGDSRAPTCDAARGPGWSRLRALTLSAVARTVYLNFTCSCNRSGLSWSAGREFRAFS